MKIKELNQINITKNKTLEERKNDAMCWFITALKTNFRFLKKYADEKNFYDFIECQKEVACYCEKFRRTVGAIKSEDISKVVKEDVNKLLDEL